MVLFFIFFPGGNFWLAFNQLVDSFWMVFRKFSVCLIKASIGLWKVLGIWMAYLCPGADILFYLLQFFVLHFNSNTRL